MITLSLLTVVGIQADEQLQTESLESEPDCSSLDVAYDDDPDLTHSERLEAMDRAFFNSLRSFELCQLNRQSSASMSSYMSDNVANGNEAASENDVLESLASPGIEGTESTETIESIESTADVATIEQLEQKQVGQGLNNGAVPEDIVDVDNDNVVAGQIRLAAELEQDPVKKEKLWNEYRKYKGLTVPAEEGEDG